MQLYTELIDVWTTRNHAPSIILSRGLIGQLLFNSVENVKIILFHFDSELCFNINLNSLTGITFVKTRRFELKTSLPLIM